MHARTLSKEGCFDARTDAERGMGAVYVDACTGVYRSLVNIHTSHEARRRTLAGLYKVSVNKS